MPDQRNSTPQRYRVPRQAQHQQPGVEGMARDQTWPGTWMVFGIFVLLISFWWVGSKTFVTYTALGRWFALFAFAGNLLPYKKVGLRLGMERLEWFLFNLLAIGPFLFSMALWLNLEVHGTESRSIVHASAPNTDVRRHWSEEGQLPPHTPIDGLGGSELQQMLYAHSGHHILGTAKGCLGYDVITTWEKIPD